MVRRRYRSHAGVIHDILETLYRKGPLPASKIARHANIPYDRFKIILASLEENGLVRKSGQDYEITSKGREALFTLKKSRRLLESLGFRF